MKKTDEKLNQNTNKAENAPENNNTAHNNRDSNQIDPTIEEIEELIPPSCRNLDPDSIESEEELLQKATEIHKELTECANGMHQSGLQNRVRAWTTGRILQRLKETSKGNFRKKAEAATGASKATITRYLKLAKTYETSADLFGTTDSLTDAYLKAGALGKEVKIATRPIDRVTEFLRKVIKNVDALTKDEQHPSEDEVNQLRELNKNLGELLERLAEPQTVETGEAVNA